MRRLQIKSRAFITRVWSVVVIGFLILLSVGTISNQLKINAANTQLARQAHNGQRALVRTCQLMPISLKVYTDNLRRGVITPNDFRQVQRTAARYCAGTAIKPAAP